MFNGIPFAGPVHDFSRPMLERLKSRKHCGPYTWAPAKPGGGRGFYQASKGLQCDRAGSTFDLRLQEANEFLGSSRLAHTNGYYADRFGDSTLRPIIARLPKGRGFLAGWTMGAGMCAALDLDIYDNEREAAMAAHDMAERDAEASRDADEMEAEEEDSEEGED